MPRLRLQSPGTGRVKRRLMRYVLRIAVATVVCAASLAGAQPLRIDRVQILERGIYHAQPDMTRGRVNNPWPVRDVRLITATSDIPMRRHLRFGVRYILLGRPSGAPVAVDLVTRYPAPGRLDPTTKERRLESRYQLTIPIGGTRYRDFQLVEDEEFIPGIWVFEFWSGARKLGEQSFCVFDPDTTSGGPPAGEICAAVQS
jgi:hypothetical protein